MTGGLNPDDPLNPVDNKEHAGFAFFRDKLGNWLNMGWVKVTVIAVYLVYVTGGIFINTRETFNITNHRFWSISSKLSIF